MGEHPFVEACDFCQIAKGEVPDTELIWRDKDWVAFFPLNPATPGHTLIIPRSHVTDLWQADLQLGSQLMAASIRMGQAITAALEPSGMNLITSSGSSAEQTVFHLHIHLVPRWEDDGFGEIWPADAKYENADLHVPADKIQEAYGVLGGTTT